MQVHVAPAPATNNTSYVSVETAVLEICLHTLTCHHHRDSFESLDKKCGS